MKEGDKEVRKRGGREEKEVKKGGEGVKRGKGQKHGEKEGKRG